MKNMSHKPHIDTQQESPAIASLTPPSGGTPIDIDIIYTPLESTFNGLQFRRWHYRSVFIRLAVVVKARKSLNFSDRPLFEAPVRGEPLGIWWWNLASEN